MSETIYTVLLKDGTTGTINSNTLGGQSASDFIGEIVTVQLFDENGNSIEIEGVLVNVLESDKNY
jgi:regulator of RNase E activity RraA